MNDIQAPALSAGPYLEADADGIHLLAGECTDCGKRVFPPPAVCPECMGENFRSLPLSREGKLYSYSVIHQGPKWVSAPYIAAYIDMPEGVRVFTHLDTVNPDLVACDMQVMLQQTEPVMNSEGREVLSFKFVPMTPEER